MEEPSATVKLQFFPNRGVLARVCTVRAAVEPSISPAQLVPHSPFHPTAVPRLGIHTPTVNSFQPDRVHIELYASPSAPLHYWISYISHYLKLSYYSPPFPSPSCGKIACPFLCHDPPLLFFPAPHSSPTTKPDVPPHTHSRIRIPNPIYSPPLSRKFCKQIIQQAPNNPVLTPLRSPLPPLRSQK